MTDERERMGEMTSINQSLSTLATVVGALTPQGRRERAHVPYRDSKLTHLLQESLGGNCRTTIVATVSPSVMCADETCSTVRFADRARNITTVAMPNTHRDSSMQLELLQRGE